MDWKGPKKAKEDGNEPHLQISCAGVPVAGSQEFGSACLVVPQTWCQIWILEFGLDLDSPQQTMNTMKNVFLYLLLTIASTSLINHCECFCQMANLPRSKHCSQPRQEKTTTASKKLLRIDALSFSKQNSTPEYYSDDLFGLIFLSGAFVFQDVVFASVFLVLSSIAALLTNVLQRLPSGPLVPGCVGGLTLVVTSAVRAMDLIPHESSSAVVAETVLCTFSVVYGLFRHQAND